MRRGRRCPQKKRKGEKLPTVSSLQHHRSYAVYSSSKTENSTLKVKQKKTYPLCPQVLLLITTKYINIYTIELVLEGVNNK